MCLHRNEKKHAWCTVSLSMLLGQHISPVAALARLDPQQRDPQQCRQSLQRRQHLLPAHLPHDTPERPYTITHCIRMSGAFARLHSICIATGLQWLEQTVSTGTGLGQARTQRSHCCSFAVSSIEQSLLNEHTTEQTF